MRKIHRHPHQTGLTLMELLCSVIIMVLLLSLAIPGYQNLSEHLQLKTAAETLLGQLQLARMEAIKLNMPVRLDFTINSPTDWCYGLSITDCNCTQLNSCQLNGVEQVISSRHFKNIAINDAKPWNNAASFNPIRGTVNAGGATLYSAHYQIRVLSSDIGRIKICNPNTDPSKPAFSNYPKCN